MTVVPPKTQRTIKMVEFTAEQVTVQYNDGSMEADIDVAEEKGMHSVDAYINPKEFPDNDKYIITNESSRNQAALWGPVREKLADKTQDEYGESELSHAQHSFNYAEARAHVIFSDFRTALKNGKVEVKLGPDKDFQLFYQDPRTGHERIFHLYPAKGEPGSNSPKFTSLSLEEEDSIRVSISDPKKLDPLREKLDPLFRDLIQKNQAFGKK